jgi:hypothetical protein
MAQNGTKLLVAGYWLRVAEHLNRPATGYLGEKIQESVYPC